MVNIIISLVLIGGIISIFRPILLIYLFAALPVAVMVSFGSEEYAAELKVIRVGPINLYATDYLLLILLILLVFEAIKISKTQTFSAFIAGPINKIIFIMFAWEVIIGILSYQKGFKMQNILRQLSTEALMFLSIFIPQIKNIDFQKEYFLKFISIACMILVFSGLWRYFISHEVTLTSSGTSRAISGSAIIILIIPICYILFYINYLYERNFFSYTIVVFMIIGVFLAGHRSGFIVLFFIYYLWYFKSEHPKIDYMFIPLWAGAFFVLALFILSTTHIVAGKSFLGDVALRFKDTFNLENQTTTHRLDMWEYSLDVVREKPLIGVGSFPFYLILSTNEGESLPTSQTELDIPPHNLFVDKLIHEGIIGLGLVIILFYIVYKQIRFISITNRAYGNFFMVYIFAFLLFSCFNTTFSNYLGKTYLFTILGFLNFESLKTQ